MTRRSPKEERLEVASADAAAAEAVRSDLITAYERETGDRLWPVLEARQREARTSRQKRMLENVLWDALAVWLERKRQGLPPGQAAAIVAQLSAADQALHEAALDNARQAKAWLRREKLDGLRLSEIIARVSLGSAKGGRPTTTDAIAHEVETWARATGLAQVYCALAKAVAAAGWDGHTYRDAEAGESIIATAFCVREHVTVKRGSLTKTVLDLPPWRPTPTDSELLQRIRRGLAQRTRPHRFTLELLSEYSGMTVRRVEQLLRPLRMNIEKHSAQRRKPVTLAHPLGLLVIFPRLSALRPRKRATPGS